MAAVWAASSFAVPSPQPLSQRERGSKQNPDLQGIPAPGIIRGPVHRAAVLSHRTCRLFPNRFNDLQADIGHGWKARRESPPGSVTETNKDYRNAQDQDPSGGGQAFPEDR